MLPSTSLHFVLLSSFFTIISPETDQIVDVHHYTDNEELETCEPQVLSSSQKIVMDSKYSSSLDLFVCPGMPMRPRYVFIDVHLDINLTDPSTFILYQGSNCSTVQDAYDSDHRLFGLLKSINLWRSMQLDPFSRTIIGISTTEKYSIGLTVNTLSAWRFGLFTGAILLYLFAPWLVRNALVFYATGCTGGALLSALLLVFLVYRVVPKKTIGIPILVGGWSAAAWMAMHAWSNFSSLMIQYQKYVALYFITAMILSFAYCYKQGPPTNVRSLDLATWLFQISACFLIYFSSQVPLISYAVIGLLLLSSALLSSTSQRMFGWVSGIWTYFFPQPRRLLTEDEYEREAVEYTEQELARLRDFCRSPEANSWKMTSKMRTPTRFARFIEGDDKHVSLREEREHLAYSLEGENYFEPDEEEEVEMEDEEEEYERWKEREEEERRERWRREREERGGRRTPAANTSRSTDVLSRPSTVPRPSRAAVSASTVLRPVVMGPSTSAPRGQRKSTLSRPIDNRRSMSNREPSYNRDYYSSDEDESASHS